jgi:CRP/FNR family transcriptional regulator, cyclic AMP receptor protein
MSAESLPAVDRRPTHISLESRILWNDTGARWRAGEFFKSLSSEAISEFESLAAPLCCEGATVLFTEEQEPSRILFLFEGSVKLSLNSIKGGRLIIGMAGPGEILGLTSAVSGLPYDMTAETQFPCVISPFPRQSFLDFLIRYPVACLNVACQLSMDHKRACEQLHRIVLTSSAPRKLARLLLEWCAVDGHDTRFHCSLTHEEIGEHIGVSRETVTRTMNDFKNRGLIEQRGALLIGPNRRLLETFAAID